MTRNQLIEAYESLNKLASLNLSVLASYRIFQWIGAAKKEVDYQLQLDKKLLEKYEIDRIENGLVYFKTPEDARKYSQDRNESLMLTAEGFHVRTPIRLDVRSIAGAKLSAEDMLNLRGFVEFYDSDEEKTEDETTAEEATPSDEIKMEVVDEKV